jgi:hypothetical protein
MAMTAVNPHHPRPQSVDLVDRGSLSSPKTRTQTIKVTAMKKKLPDARP